MSETPASAVQIGGNHYKDMAIQPSEFIQRNGMNWCEGNVIKYVARHRSKNGAQDLQKARHYLDLLLEWEYPVHQSPPAHPYLHKSELTREEAKELADAVAPPSLCVGCIRQCDVRDDSNHVRKCGLRLTKAADKSRCNTCHEVGFCMSSLKWEEGGCDGYRDGNTRPQTPPADEWAGKDLCRRCGVSSNYCEHAGIKRHMAECRFFVGTSPSPSPLSLALPSITVPGDLEEVRKKYVEEYDEWCMATADLARLIEAWDVAQVVQTLTERGGKDELDFNPAIHYLQIRHKEEPEWVEAAKRGMVIKNAARAMYAPEVNSKIIMSAGKEW